MRILALEPYFGGSHRRFLEGWSASSRHDWHLLGLPARNWKWRMRHSAVTFAEKSAEIPSSGSDSPFDAIVASEMLNLAEFLGLGPRWAREIPSIVYFHENQVTYPDRHPDPRDGHLAFTNITSALAATAVWFNSRFHLDSFASGARSVLAAMPDYRRTDWISLIGRKSLVMPPGIDPVPATTHSEQRDEPLTILWSARWEHDKNPELFHEALRALRHRTEKPFRLIVLGAQFRNQPSAFGQIKVEFTNELLQFGFVESRIEYERFVAMADVILSTAKHEFFGLSVVEALSAGVHPLLPDALAYPEVIERCIQSAPTASREAPCVRQIDQRDFFHDSTATGIAERLLVMIERKNRTGTVWRQESWRAHLADAAASQFGWSSIVGRMDDAIEHLATDGSHHAS